MSDNPRILFLHIGWARDYRGDPDDIPQGKFGFLRATDDTPGETFNFRPYNARCYGYSPHHAFNMARLDARGDDYVDDVLVIWTATNPDGTGRFIVGWYKNARVYAEGEERRPERGNAYVVCEAAADDCHLVALDDRTFYVPAMEAGYPGVSSAFYASNTLSTGDIAELQAYVAGKPSLGFFNGIPPTAPATDSSGWPAIDVADRIAVEKAAIEAVTAFYKARNWTVVSVEKNNVGWDLQVTKGARILLVEVKGRGGSGVVELTPNEYRAMLGPKTRMSYRLAIVFNAVSEPAISIFEFAPGRESWVSEDGVVLRLEEATGALARF